MLKPLNFTPPTIGEMYAQLQTAYDNNVNELGRVEAEIDRLRALLTEANDEILFWRKQAQDWHDKACPDRTKPFTTTIDICEADPPKQSTTAK